MLFPAITNYADAFLSFAPPVRFFAMSCHAIAVFLFALPVQSSLI
jgi:hypothetical protein